MEENLETVRGFPAEIDFYDCPRSAAVPRARLIAKVYVSGRTQFLETTVPSSALLEMIFSSVRRIAHVERRLSITIYPSHLAKAVNRPGRTIV